ncbi:Gfo/Idh/MocA family oxidoreductase [Myceligenerans pegani]|uniref:Gfo/Idh/MocA family oxidoreductase n=1 Tax=Myceligenerans pegani TaxID=2776917 RepID=UPI001CEFD9A5|nr:Gfo/Idh/MocA family oxidoreductase [Myceligenerans sp. TRM 65318]
MRIGLLGVDSSRPVRVVTYLGQVAAAGAPHRLVAIATEGAAPPVELRTLAPEAELVEQANELLGRVDAVIDVGRRAGERRARLTALLESGVHVLADKPLARRAVDAEALVAAARRGHSALAADSGYRGAVEPWMRTAGATSVEISGPADLGSPSGGLAFYGIHHAQILHELIGLPPSPRLRVARSGPVVTAALTAGQHQVRLCFDPGSAFAVSIGGVVHALDPPADYLERLVDRFLASCADVRLDSAWADRLCAPVRLVERIEAAASGQSPT